jgi:hypothetical protein
MDFTIPEGWKALNAAVRSFCDGVIEPIWRRIEDAILRELGYADAEVRALESRGVVRSSASDSLRSGVG